MGLATLTTKTVARKNLCIYGYAFDVASVSLFCVHHAEPARYARCHLIGTAHFVRCLRQFLWRVLPGPLSAIIN